MSPPDDGLPAVTTPFANVLWLTAAVQLCNLVQRRKLAINAHPEVAAAGASRAQRAGQFGVQCQEGANVSVGVYVDRAKPSTSLSQQHAYVVLIVQHSEIFRCHVCQGNLLPAKLGR